MKQESTARHAGMAGVPPGGGPESAGETSTRSRPVVLARLLTSTDQLATLLPTFHQHAVEAAGGSRSVLFQVRPESGRLYATSAYAVDRLPADSWPQTRLEIALLERVMQSPRPEQVTASDVPGRALGTLVFERVRIDPGGELDLLARADEVGRLLSAAIENVQLLEGVLRARRELENTFNSIADLVVVSDRRVSEGVRTRRAERHRDHPRPRRRPAARQGRRSACCSRHCST